MTCANVNTSEIPETLGSSHCQSTPCQSQGCDYLPAYGWPFVAFAQHHLHTRLIKRRESCEERRWRISFNDWYLPLISNYQRHGLNNVQRALSTNLWQRITHLPQRDREVSRFVEHTPRNDTHTRRSLDITLQKDLGNILNSFEGLIPQLSIDRSTTLIATLVVFAHATLWLLCRDTDILRLIQLFHLASWLSAILLSACNCFSHISPDALSSTAAATISVAEVTTLRADQSLSEFAITCLSFRSQRRWHQFLRFLQHGW